MEWTIWKKQWGLEGERARGRGITNIPLIKNYICCIMGDNEHKKKKKWER